MTAFNLSKYKNMFILPDRIETPLSWVGHIPFAFFIVELLKPKILVELGVHTGNSYNAYCQAVKNLSLDTICFGIDTWQGDEQAGFYDETVFNNLNQYQNLHYSSQSFLLKMKFDEALDCFSKNTIDLLHIDGCHNYSVVKHDFESWLPKMQKDGVLILHDIAERTTGYGVWQLWEEIKQNYETIEFTHSHGLGVVFLNKKNEEVSQFVDSFLEMRFLSQLFVFAGSRIKKEYELINENVILEKKVIKTSTKLFNKKHELIQKDSELALKNQVNELAQMEIRFLGEKISEVQQELDYKNSELSLIYRKLETRQQEMKQLNIKLIESTHNLAQKDSELTVKNRELEASQQEVLYYSNSSSWKITAPLRKINYRGKNFFTKISRNLLLANKLKSISLFGKKLLAKKPWKSPHFSDSLSVGHPSEVAVFDKPYRNWIRINEPTLENLKEQSFRAKCFPYQPLVSIVMPVWNTDKALLIAAIDSVKKQTYENWELCIAEGNSDISYIKEVLEDYKNNDSRIKVSYLKSNLGISGNSNHALSMASGEFIALLDHDDTLAPFALFELVKLLNSNPNYNYIYSDEDKIDINGNRYQPFFKPDWSPEYLLSCGYTNHLSIYRKKLIGITGGFRNRCEGSQDYDLVLRCTELSEAKEIGHIPKILYHWRQTHNSTASDPYAKESIVLNSAKQALSDALFRRQIDGIVEDGLWAGSYRIVRKLNQQPLVSIIVPTKDKLSYLKKCIATIELLTSYPNYEIIIVDNMSKNEQTLSYLATLHHTVITYPEEFNYSRINNLAAQNSKGDVLMFLNNDTEVITPDWIQYMLEYALDPSIGAVGAKLIYPDKSIQHAGVILGMSPDQRYGIAGHIYANFPEKAVGYFGSINVARNYSAVTAAAMMVQKERFFCINGFDERLAVCYNDVDFCLRLQEKGLRIVYNPYVEFIHHESISRGYFVDYIEAKYMIERWGILLREDPYYSPNLSLSSYNCSIKE